MREAKLEAAAVRGALLTRLVILSLIKAGYEHVEPLPLEDIHAIVIDNAGRNGTQGDDYVIES